MFLEKKIIFFIDEVKKYCDCNNKEIYVIEDAGHICNIDNYNKFNTIIEKYYSYIKS